VQAQDAPAVLPGHQRGPEFVAQTERRHDLPVARADRSIAARGAIQRHDPAGRPGQAANLFTSSRPNSLSRNNGVATPSGSSATAMVNNKVTGSTVAKKAASTGMTRRSRPSTSSRSWAASSPA